MTSFRQALGPEAVARLENLTQQDRAPFLSVGAAAWTDPLRRELFKHIYGVMRVMDDRVDALKSQIGKDGSPATENPQVIAELEASCQTMAKGNSPSLFPWVLKSWLAAMVQDTRESHFRTYRDLYRYSHGAAVAPGVIFLALATHPEPQTEAAVVPLGAALARFCYAVHLARDLEVDAGAGVCNIPLNVLKGLGLSPKSFIKEVLAPTPSARLREIVGLIQYGAGHFRRLTLGALAKMPPHWPPDARFSVLLVFRLYDLIFGRLKGDLPTFDTAAFTPTAAERRRTLHELLEQNIFETPAMDPRRVCPEIGTHRLTV